MTTNEQQTAQDEDFRVQMAHEHVSGMHDAYPMNTCELCLPDAASLASVTPLDGRYVVNVNVTVHATSDDEATSIVERALAGIADHDIVDVFAEEPSARR